MNHRSNIKKRDVIKYRGNDMSFLCNFNRLDYIELGASHENAEAVETIEDFDRLIRTIRERPLKPISGFWLNLVEYRNHQFIQGEIRNECSASDDFRQIAALVDGVKSADIEGFWPEAQGYKISKTEESLIASYLARQGKNDVELIVPERNTARPVVWDRFDESPEFETYKKFIYPAILQALETIEAHRDKLKAFL